MHLQANKLLNAVTSIALLAMGLLGVFLILAALGIDLQSTHIKVPLMLLSTILFGALLYQLVFWLRILSINKDRRRFWLCLLLPYAYSFYLSVCELKFFWTTKENR